MIYLLSKDCSLALIDDEYGFPKRLRIIARRSKGLSRLRGGHPWFDTGEVIGEGYLVGTKRPTRRIKQFSYSLAKAIGENPRIEIRRGCTRGPFWFFDQKSINAAVSVARKIIKTDSVVRHAEQFNISAEAITRLTTYWFCSVGYDSEEQFFDDVIELGVTQIMTYSSLSAIPFEQTERAATGKRSKGSAKDE